jgi:nucleoside-diphosphate-sugar epimerase
MPAKSKIIKIPKFTRQHNFEKLIKRYLKILIKIGYMNNFNDIIEEDLNSIIGSDINWNAFSGKTILITGANGFLPAYMLQTLLYLNKRILSNHCKIVALVRNIKHAKTRFASILHDKNFRIINQDVSNPIKIKEKIDFIIHAASPASPKYYSGNPIDVIMPNCIGTKNTLDLAYANKIEGYLFFSSGEVYGELPSGTLITEDSYGYLDPTKIRSCYGESKRMGENLCISYGHQYDISTKIIRISHTYGPGMKLDDGRVFADFVKNVVHNENIEIKSDGNAVRPFCYISDAVAAFFTVLLKGDRSNTYNVANPDQSISINGLAKVLVSLFPEKGLGINYAQRKIDDHYLESRINEPIVDISKIKSLGWKPSINIRDGFYRTIKSYL